MRMKLLYLVCLLGYSIAGLSQKGKHFSIEGLLLAGTDSSYYYIEKISGSIAGVDTIKFYYQSSKKLLAIHTMNEGLLDGPFNYYYENGQLRLKGVNKSGKPFGDVYAYYLDGKSKSVITFSHPYEASGFNENFIITSYWDTQGNQLVNNGEGNCKCEFDILSTDYDLWQEESIQGGGKINCWYKNFKFQYFWEGAVKNGRRNSIWKAYRDGVLELEEEYNNGKFVSGTRLDSEKKIKYEVLEETSEPEGGIINFYRFVGKTMRYPAEARRKGIQGKVFVEFVVNRDGSLSNVKSIKAPHPVLADEAIRVVNMAPKWNPAKQRGKPVRQKMVVPLIFKLG